MGEACRTCTGEIFKRSHHLAQGGSQRVQRSGGTGLVDGDGVGVGRLKETRPGQTSLQLVVLLLVL